MSGRWFSLCLVSLASFVNKVTVTPGMHESCVQLCCAKVYVIESIPLYLVYTGIVDDSIALCSTTHLYKIYS